MDMVALLGPDCLILGRRSSIIRLTLILVEHSKDFDHLKMKVESCFGFDMHQERLPGLYGALVARTGRSRCADRDAPNESSVAQLRAALWPETCFGPTCIQNVKAASMYFRSFG